LQGFGGAGLIPAVVGFDARAVKGDFAEPDQTERHGDAPDLPEQVFERLAKPGTELIEGGVIDVPPLDEPDEIEAIIARFFEFSAAADAPVHAIEDGCGDAFGLDRRLPFTSRIIVFPRRPIDRIQDFVDQADGIVGRNQRIEGGKIDREQATAAIERRVGPIILSRHGATPSLPSEPTNVLLTNYTLPINGRRLNQQAASHLSIYIIAAVWNSPSPTEWPIL